MPKDNFDEKLREVLEKKAASKLLKVFEDEGILQKKQTKCDAELEKFITNYPEMLELKEEVRKLSEVQYPVLIIGDTGTGKELLAKALHGDRAGEFIPINCAGIPEALIESELFGHVKGAFTGSIADREGLMQQAKNGTLFLDEVGDLPLAMQSKLLRVLQEMTVRKIGANKEEAITCRIVCATHKKIEDMVACNTFREDLYWRISTFTLRPKPLSVRSMDIPLLVKHLDKEKRIENIDKFCALIDKDKLTGNVRTLEQIILRYYVLGKLPHK